LLLADCRCRAFSASEIDRGPLPGVTADTLCIGMITSQLQSAKGTAALPQSDDNNADRPQSFDYPGFAIPESSSSGAAGLDSVSSVPAHFIREPAAGERRGCGIRAGQCITASESWSHPGWPFGGGIAAIFLLHAVRARWRRWHRRSRPAFVTYNGANWLLPSIPAPAKTSGLGSSRNKSLFSPLPKELFALSPRRVRSPRSQTTPGS